MTEIPSVIDPSARFVDQQQDDLVDFIFRLTGDRSRAGVMGREVCRFMKDELSSQMDEPLIRSRLFQLAYELNEEVMRPIARTYFEAWFRHQHENPKTVPILFRWELKLLDLGHHAAQLLLLRYRYRFSVASCAHILYRDEDGVQKELIILEALVNEEKGLKVDELTQLPRYGFLEAPEPQTTALSSIMRQLRPRPRWWALLAMLAALSLLGIFFWMLKAFVDFRQLWRFVRAWLLT